MTELSAADAVLYEAVRSADSALERLDGMLERVGGWAPERLEALMASRLAPDMFTFAQQVRTAVDFAQRMVLPLAGQTVPPAPGVEPGLQALRERIGAARAAMDLPEAAFGGAAARQLRERAGFADLELTGTEMVLRFGMPNLWFHLTIAYALLRAAGAEVGKSDIDGLHDYPPGFRF